MEPLSIIGAAASVATVVQMCTECLNSLLRWQTKYQNADLTTRLIVTQLSTLRAALSQITEWLDDGVQTASSHVLSDLILSLDGCKLIVKTLDDRLTRLEYTEDNVLNVRSKARVLWDEKERTDFQTSLSHNIAALQLLLTVMQCRSQSEQSILLQTASHREVMAKAQDDSSSLLWLRDDESQGTRRSICTENIERLDCSFLFDREIFNSRPYLTATTSNMKRVVREDHLRAQAKHFATNEDNAYTITKGTEDLQGTTANFRTSPDCDSTLSKGRSHEESSLHLPERTDDEVASSSASFRTAQSSTSRQGSKASINGARSPKEANHGSRRLLRMPSLLKSRSFGSSPTATGMESISPIPLTCDEQKLLLIGNARATGGTLLKSIELAYGELCQLNVSEEDGIREYLVSRKSAGIRYRYRIYDVIGLHSEENKWIYSFDERPTLIYVVDLSRYDLAAPSGQPLSGIGEDLMLFERLCSSKWLATSSILLVLGGIDVLTSKLQDIPLAEHFPDYKGSATDLEASKSFLRQKYLCLNQKYALRIWTIFSESMATVRLGRVIMANIDMIFTERKVLAFGTR